MYKDLFRSFIFVLIICLPFGLSGQSNSGSNGLTPSGPITTGSTVTIDQDQDRSKIGIGLHIGHYSANDIDNGLRLGVSVRIAFLNDKFEGEIGGGGISEVGISPDGGYFSLGVGYLIKTTKDFYVVPGLSYFWQKIQDSNLPSDSYVGPTFRVWHDLGGFRYGAGVAFGYVSGRKFFVSQGVTFSFDL